MLEIEHKKREKINELKKIQKKRKCRACVSFFAGGVTDLIDDGA